MGYTCTINPQASNANEVEKIPKPQSSRKVLVIGGGMAGMQAAITAFDRGHKVTLVEKSGSLGGITRFTDFDIHKVDLKNFKDLLIREVDRRDIHLMLNTDATLGFVIEFAPDAMILAIGGSPAVPPIPGINTAIHALQVYQPNVKIGRRVVIIGGGLAGCETALQLADTGHEVTIIEMMNELAADEIGLARMATLTRISETKNVAVRTAAKCVEIAPGKAVVSCAESSNDTVYGDTIIYSLGITANRAEVETLRDAAGNIAVFEVGDCIRGAKVFEAVSEGFLAAMKII